MAVTYEQHKEFLYMVKDGAINELNGFLDASRYSYPVLSSNPRYMQGWNDGKAKLIQDQATAPTGDE